MCDGLQTLAVFLKGLIVVAQGDLKTEEFLWAIACCQAKPHISVAICVGISAIDGARSQANSEGVITVDASFGQVSLLNLRRVLHRGGMVVVMVRGTRAINKHAVIGANCAAYAVCPAIRSAVVVRYDRTSNGSMYGRARRCPCVYDRGPVVVSM